MREFRRSLLALPLVGLASLFLLLCCLSVPTTPTLSYLNASMGRLILVLDLPQSPDTRIRAGLFGLCADNAFGRQCTAKLGWSMQVRLALECQR